MAPEQICKIIQQTMCMLSFQAIKKKIEVECEFSDISDYLVIIDSLRVK
jgi:hypothetical protein